MSKSIKLNNDTYWAPNSVVINGSGTTLATVFDSSTSKISNTYLNVDTTYDATSSNPQSGTAVAQAIAAAITTALNTPV